MQPGQLDPWRSDHQSDRERVQELVQRIELRGQAPAEVETRAAYLDLLGITAGMCVLDVGCGSGVVTRELSRRVQPGGWVLGVDPNPYMLEFSRAREDNSGIEFRVGDALALPVDSATFDAVVCVTVLEHMVEPERAIPELVRAARPGGRVGVLCGEQESFIVAHPDRQLTRQIIATFADLGFANPWIGRQVPGLLEQAGVHDVEARGFVTLDRDPKRFSRRAAELRAEVAHRSGAITEQQRDDWIAQLPGEGAFLAGSIYVFTWGTRS